jgi:hypothetical protein
VTRPGARHADAQHRRIVHLQPERQLPRPGHLHLPRHRRCAPLERDDGRAAGPARARLHGLCGPIDNGVTNTAKAGQAIPVKCRLTTPAGTPVSDPASFVSLNSQSGGGFCAGLPVDAIETYARSSGLQYLGNGNWQFNWQTPKNYAGQCRPMTLTLNDGSTHTAAFMFK